MREIINKPYWSFVGVVIAIPALIMNFAENIPSITDNWSLAITSIKWILIIGAFIFGWYGYIKPRRSEREAREVLQNIGGGKVDKTSCNFSYGLYDYTPILLDSKWKEIINKSSGKYGLVKKVDRPDLDYFDFGNEFYFFDLKACKKIEIPTGTKAKTDRVGDTLKKGMVLRLMSKGIQIT